jgi:hypothetical protein
VHDSNPPAAAAASVRKETPDPSASSMLETPVPPSLGGPGPIVGQVYSEGWNVAGVVMVVVLQVAGLAVPAESILEHAACRE